MTQSSQHPDPPSEFSSRERIDALLDEALAESFPASDSSAIGSGTTAIKQEHRKRKARDRPKPQGAPADARKPGDTAAP